MSTVPSAVRTTSWPASDAEDQPEEQPRSPADADRVLAHPCDRLSATSSVPPRTPPMSVGSSPAGPQDTAIERHRCRAWGPREPGTLDHHGQLKNNRRAPPPTASTGRPAPNLQAAGLGVSGGSLSPHLARPAPRPAHPDLRRDGADAGLDPRHPDAEVNQRDWTAAPSCPVAGSRATIEYVTGGCCAGTGGRPGRVRRPPRALLEDGVGDRDPALFEVRAPPRRRTAARACRTGSADAPSGCQASGRRSRRRGSAVQVEDAGAHQAKSCGPNAPFGEDLAYTPRRASCRSSPTAA